MEEFPRRRRVLDPAYGLASLAAGAVLDEWLSLLRPMTPWCDMPLDDVAGEFHVLVVELLVEHRHLDGGARIRCLCAAARGHGWFRRCQACAPETLTEEVVALESVISEVLLRFGSSSEAITSTLDTLAPDLRFVARSAHAGYFDRPLAFDL